LTIDPTNPLYQPGGAPASATAYEPVAATIPVSGFGGSTVPQSAHAELAPDLSGGVDLDLDLDFSLDEHAPTSAISDVTGADISLDAERTMKLDAPTDEHALDMDFDLDVEQPSASAPSFEPVSQMPEISLSLDDLEVPLDMDNSAPLKFEATSPVPVEATPAASQTGDLGMMDFDMGSLSMELDSPAEQPTGAPDNLSQDPLETKLALAEEFISIGDEDGARALIEEVMSEATGDMRAKAQKALAQLS